MDPPQTWISRKMSTTTNPETLKQMKAVSTLSKECLTMSEEFEWELLSREFRTKSADFFTPSYDSKIAKLNLVLDDLPHYDWTNSLTHTGHEAVEWATNQSKCTKDQSPQPTAEESP